MGRSHKQQQLDQTIALLRQRYGESILRRLAEMERVSQPAHLSTGFAPLDSLTGCNGIPLDSLTVLSGPTTSGK